MIEKEVILMEQILESTYFKDTENWNRIAKQNGGLEICGEDGYPIYTIGWDDYDG